MTTRAPAVLTRAPAVLIKPTSTTSWRELWEWDSVPTLLAGLQLCIDLSSHLLCHGGLRQSCRGQHLWDVRLWGSVSCAEHKCFHRHHINYLCNRDSLTDYLFCDEKHQMWDAKSFTGPNWTAENEPLTVLFVLDILILDENNYKEYICDTF